MAIAKMKNGAPYIHSNVDYFKDGLGGSLTDTIVVGSDEMNQTIDSLRKISEQLKNEAEDFLMGMEVKEVRADLLKLPDTYAGIATEIIQNHAVIASLVNNFNINTKDIEDNIFKNANKKDAKIRDYILNEIKDVEQISASRLAAIIGQSFVGNGSGQLTEVGMKISKFFEFDSSLKEQIEEEMNKGVYKRFRKPQAGIVKVIKDLLVSSSLVKNKTNSIDNFLDTFEKIFIPEAKVKIKIYPVDFQPEDYMRELRKILKREIKQDIQDIRNAAGLINENILASVYAADRSTKISFTAVGTKTENDIIKEFPSLNNMRSHHIESKQSQSDMILCNAKGKVVRAQSKTSISSYKIQNEDTEKMLNYLQRSTNIYKLLVSLNKNGAFPINNINDICYVLANALWFNTHVSVSGIRERGNFTKKSAKVDTSIMSEVAEAINVELSRQIPSFLGISLKETVQEIEVDAGGSNIFYIENGFLVPTYLELNEVIKDLEDYVKEATKMKALKITIEQRSGGIKWPENNAVQFWLKKYGKEEYDPAPGFTQGEAAISSMSVHGNFYAISRFSSFPIGK